ncbi:MAG TPA: ATP-binding protein [Thermoanaerobaculia bacterium]|nr:ATP-binding protein [Thermoanaerobaculia bacterium]
MGDPPKYLSRYAGETVRRAMKVSPVVVLMGPRQTGKSTLVRTEPFLAHHLYLTLDDLDVRDRAATRPDDLLRSAPRIVLDEVQREPDLILAIKRAIDSDRPRVPGRFVLTGSSNLLLMQRISETLAGRASYINLWPLTRREKLGLGTTGIWSDLLNHKVSQWYDIARSETLGPAHWRREAAIGGYPTPAVEIAGDDLRTIWFDGYVRTYLERDLQDLAAIDNLPDFRRLMKAASLRLANLLNQAELGRDTGIPRPTVQRYLNLLETSFQLIRLEPYSVNRTKRLIKSPKVFWSDTGLALHLAGDPTPSGPHLENLVLSDLLAWRDGQIPRPEILYWRTASDLEVDFVIESGRKLIPIEVKATAKPGLKDIRGLVAFRDEYPDHFSGGLLLHDGDEIQWLSDRILSVPWHRVV